MCWVTRGCSQTRSVTQAPSSWGAYTPEAAGDLCRRPEPRVAHRPQRALFVRPRSVGLSEAYNIAGMRQCSIDQDRSRCRHPGTSRGAGRARAFRGAPSGKRVTESSWIIALNLDESFGRGRRPELEQERAVAIEDLVEENHFALADGPDGPYHLVLGIAENRLVFRVQDKGQQDLKIIGLAPRSLPAHHPRLSRNLRELLQRHPLPEPIPDRDHRYWPGVGVHQ